MRPLHLRHDALQEIAQSLLDLYPSNADVSEVGPDARPALFFSWRTSGAADHPGNIAWGVHYRFAPGTLQTFAALADDARRAACDQARALSRELRFDYADPQAVSLLVVDLTPDWLTATA